MTPKVMMRALVSRSYSQSPTGKALARGVSYSTTEDGARDDEKRGVGQREPTREPLSKTDAV